MQGLQSAIAARPKVLIDLSPDVQGKTDKWQVV